MKTVLAELRCSICGHLSPIQRKAARRRAPGHTKHLYCPTCRQIRAHTEVRDD